MAKGLRLLWGTDGKNGKDDPRNLASILLDQMTEVENYSKYRGYKNGSTGKIEICKKLAEMMNHAGVVITRPTDDVQKKIETIKTQMRRTFDWENNTGAGLMESGSEKDKKSFHDELISRCEYFDLLEPIFSDRVGSAPSFTSATIFNKGGAIVQDTTAEHDMESNRLAILDMQEDLNDNASKTQ